MSGVGGVWEWETQGTQKTLDKSKKGGALHSTAADPLTQAPDNPTRLGTITAERCSGADNHGFYLHMPDEFQRWWEGRRGQVKARAGEGRHAKERCGLTTQG